jgi:fructose-specific phosphotransferase system component IIB
MSDEAIKNALSRRADLEIKISKAEELIKRSKSQITEINKFIKQWERFSGKSVDAISLEKAMSEVENILNFITSPKEATQKQNPKKERVAEEVVHILQKEQRPVSRDELFEMLQTKGISLHGTNPRMVLSTMLWRIGDAYDIVRLKSGGYTLRNMIAQGDEEDTSSIDEAEE